MSVAPDSLGRELQALQRGRGLSRPDIHAWIGPELRRLIAGADRLTDTELRAQLGLLLSDASLSLPRDLAYLFLIAAGIDSDGRFLRDRLAEAGQALDRDPRTLSRRLREAEFLLASVLAEEPPATASDDDPWMTTRAEMNLDLRGTRPVMIVHQVLKATTEAPTQFRAVLAAAAPLVPDDLKVEVVEGGSLVSLEPLSERSCAAVASVPPTGLGRAHAIQYRIEFPTREHLFPFVLFSPVIPAISFDALVRFDPRERPRIWEVDAGYGPLAGERPLGAEFLTPADGVVEAHFTQLRPGLCYGLAWEG